MVGDGVPNQQLLEMKQLSDKVDTELLQSLWLQRVLEGTQAQPVVGDVTRDTSNHLAQ